MLRMSASSESVCFGVAAEADVAEIELVVLVHGHLDAQLVLAHVEHRVLDHGGVAVTVLVVHIDDRVQVGAEVLRIELARAEDVPPALAAGVLHGAAQLVVGEVLVPVELNVP
jgi:hypothetical protein